MKGIKYRFYNTFTPNNEQDLVNEIKNVIEREIAKSILRKKVKIPKQFEQDLN